MLQQIAGKMWLSHPSSGMLAVVQEAPHRAGLLPLSKLAIAVVDGHDTVWILALDDVHSALYVIKGERGPQCISTRPLYEGHTSA
jgi:hypothetical protein